MRDLHRVEAEALGFCPDSKFPFEGCLDSGMCVCPLKGSTREQLAAYVAEIREDLTAMRAGGGES